MSSTTMLPQASVKRKLTRRVLIEYFDSLKCVDSKRVPERPLFLLLALGRLQQNKPRLMSFAEIEEQLEDLLEMYGRPVKPRPEYPFWHLRTAEFWEIPAEQSVPTQSGSAARKYLRDNDIKAGFTEEAFKLIESHPELEDKLVMTLLEDHFPDSLHNDILDDAGVAQYY